MEGFSGILNQIKFAWISLILSIKSFFSSNKHTSSNISSNKQEGNKIDSEDEHDVFEDALTEQELGDEERGLDEEEFFDAVEDLKNEQENSERKEYEKNKYYSLQDSLQEKTEFDRATHTLALAFEIDDQVVKNCNIDLSKFKLCELKQNGDKYTFTLEDDGKNHIELHSKYINIYFPKYFEKHCEKGMYTELLSPEENGISNDIIIPLQVPKEVDIFTEQFGWMNPKKIIQSQIPDYPKKLYLGEYKDNIDLHWFHSPSSLKLTHTFRLSPIPRETNWPIKDILIRGGFVNQHIDEQSRVEEVSSDSELEYIEVEPVNQISQRK